MKIAKGIEVLEHEKERIWNYHNLERRDALTLGIEALKRLQDNRKDPEFDHWVLLPGETEE